MQKEVHIEPEPRPNQINGSIGFARLSRLCSSRAGKVSSI